MSVIVYENWGDGEYSSTLTKQSSGSSTIHCEGTNDLQTAAFAIQSWLPATLFDLNSASGYLLLDKFGPIKRLSEYTWECPVSYVDPEGSGSDKRDPPKLGEFKCEFDVSAINQRVTFSEKGSFTAYIDPAVPGGDPNPEGAINFSKHDGKIKVEGIDIRVPSLKLSISYRLPRGTITTAYVRRLRDKVLKRNSATWLGWGPRELLFVGATGSQALFGEPELKFEFETDIEVKKKYGEIPQVTKPPHDYLDLVYDTEADEAAKKLVGKPIAAYVHNFYGVTNFPALFGFGP